MGKSSSHIEKIPFGTIRSDGNDFGAGLETGGEKTTCDTIGNPVVIVNAVFDPLAFTSDSEHIWFRWKMLFKESQDIKSPPEFKTSN
jgi:hypothetical protein